MEKIKFNFEDLDVWQKAVKFASRLTKACDNLKTDRKHYRLIEQLESAAASISMNVAEGKGRYSKREYIQFLYVARGSLFEVITLLTIFYENKWIDEEQLDVFKCDADEIGKMLSGLIRYVRDSLD